MRIALGADHAGFELKELLSILLNKLGHNVIDVGTSSSEAVDYPVYARAVAEEVGAGRCERGIMVDGVGIGSAMVANKVPGVRAAMAYDLTTARSSREHNDANLLTLGAGQIGPRLAEQIVAVWLESSCTEERHRRRVDQIEGRPSPAGTATFPPHAVALPGTISEEDLERIAHELRKVIERGGVAPRRGESSAPPRGPVAQSASARRAGTPGAAGASDAIARAIDHTLLRPDATAEEIRQLCAEAREHRFAAVCVNPVWASLAARELAGTPVRTCAVVGFPLGAAPPESKAFEARRAIRDGAKEIDMVIPIGALKGGDDEAVLRDIRAVVEACRDGGAICKVIIEAAYLTDEEKRRACRIARRARAGFVKTSTGFGPGGATVADVALMAAEVAGSGIEVKAAGGIRSHAEALRMIEAGATRIGTSRGVAIVREAGGARQTAAAAAGGY